MNNSLHRYNQENEPLTLLLLPRHCPRTFAFYLNKLLQTHYSFVSFSAFSIISKELQIASRSRKRLIKLNNKQSEEMWESDLMASFFLIQSNEELVRCSQPRLRRWSKISTNEANSVHYCRQMNSSNLYKDDTRGLKDVGTVKPNQN